MLLLPPWKALLPVFGSSKQKSVLHGKRVSIADKSADLIAK
jgi:hypothetical protein